MGSPRIEELNELQRKFENFDDLAVYEKVEKAVRRDSAQNFVVRFGPRYAEVALDLEADDLTALHHLRDDEKFPIFWM